MNAWSRPHLLCEAGDYLLAEIDSHNFVLCTLQAQFGISSWCVAPVVNTVQTKVSRLAWFVLAVSFPGVTRHRDSMCERCVGIGGSFVSVPWEPSLFSALRFVLNVSRGKKKCELDIADGTVSHPFWIFLSPKKPTNLSYWPVHQHFTPIGSHTCFISYFHTMFRENVVLWILVCTLSLARVLRGRFKGKNKSNSVLGPSDCAQSHFRFLLHFLGNNSHEGNP